ncbi:phasin family protein [Microvirga solisilvae]|uniref:phasin family protein n=1 Tax=Microvirga solisilvae TaxID=2919498 RepID=UPI001FAF2F36|nr:phasin family protein [Microvirga solisilvae]
MATMQKTSGITDTRRSTHALVTSGDRSQALINAAETWLSAAAACQREMIGFVSMRLDKDSETAREMMSCKSPTDMAAVHTRWIEETLRDYNSEMSKLMELCTKAVNSKTQS